MNSTESEQTSLSMENTSALSTPQSFQDDTTIMYEHYANILFAVVMPIVTVTGVTGNIISLIIMNRPSMRSTSVSVIISALAVADTVVLIMDFLQNWVNVVSGYLILNISGIFCSVYRYIFDSTYTLSAWLVVSMSVERFIIVMFPLRAKSLCTRKTAIGAVIGLPLVLAAIYSYNLLAWELDRNGNCNIRPHYEYLIGSVHPWITASLYCYSPVTILLFCTSSTIVQLQRMKQRRDEMMSGQQSVANTERKITIMVIVICIIFIAFTTPLTAYYVIVFNAGQLIYYGGEMVLFERIILILALSNHAINFILYAVTSQKFRQELKSMCSMYSSERTDAVAAITEPSTKISKY